MLVSLYLVLSLCLPALGYERFDEELFIRPLHDGRVASRFSFKTLLKDATPRNPKSLAGDDIQQHYTLFPLTLGQILREYAVTELHLTLNAGKWNYDSWGPPLEPGVGAGAELWVWMGDGAPTSIDERWQGLRNALAGLFCASLGSLEQRTTSPALSFAPEGSLPAWDTPHQIRHASLASEHVCTENLTPFLKLLPCKSLSGLASLLNPHKLFDADWHGMGLDVVWLPEQGVEVQLTFQAVSDPLRYSFGESKNWSFRSLYDRTVDRSCPVASTSRTLVKLPGTGMYRITPEPSSVDNHVALFDVSDVTEPLDVSLFQPEEFYYPLTPPDPPLTHLIIQRTLTGSSQDRGKLNVVIRNNDKEVGQVLYLETMPWLLQFYLHTMQVSVDNVARPDLLSNISYIPPLPHSRPATFQGVLRLPGHSTVKFSMDVTKAFLRYTDHPPDAQRGWDLPPAVFVPILSRDNSSTEFGDRIYTPTLLADLATPDFSMPYNVIIFTCSLVAFLFGSIFNLLTRKFVVVRLDGEPR
ncbi:GPI transamidase component PIG-T [Mycena floridula]|nr:GPI transamidase component PIG-T [Mycena floridula]